MGKLDHLGIAFTGRTPGRSIIEYARQADRCGVGSLWITESLYFRGALSILSAAAAATERIQLGPGVASIFSRHPALMAMEAASIDEISSGRFFLGLGATPFVPIDDFKSLHPLTAMKEYVHILDEFLSQRFVSYEGKVFQAVKAEHFSPTGTSLNFQPFRSHVPIFVGTTGPMTLKLAGKIADGVILTNLSNPSYIQWVADHVREGAREAGRDPEDLKICAFITVSVDQDEEKAREAAKEILAIYYHNIGEVAASNVGTPPEGLRLLGVTADHYRRLDAALKDGGVKEATKLIGDEEIERSAVTGTPAQVVDQLVPYVEAGLNVPIAFHTLGPDKMGAIEMLGQEVAPALSARMAQLESPVSSD